MKFHDVELGRMLAVQKQRGKEKSTVLFEKIFNGWVGAGCPYYKLYPAIHSMLSSIKLIGKLGQYPMQSFGPIAVRMPEGAEHQIECAPGVYLTAITFAVSDDTFHHPKAGGAHHGCLLMCAEAWSVAERKKLLQVYMMFGDRDVDESIVEMSKLWPRVDGVVGGSDPPPSGMDSAYVAIVQASLRVALLVMLLRDDSDFVTPEVLGKDEHKWARATEEQRKVMVDRAVRRGKLGWSIGREYESTPHWRRPHFALRWCGIGRKEPRIVAVKGAVVHRDKLTTVPTGHYVDGAEVDR